MYKRDWDTKKAVEMYESGDYTQLQIANAMGVDRKVINYYFKKRNIVSPTAPRKLDINTIRYEFKEKGYELITSKYTNAKQLLSYVCLEHKQEGVQQMTYDKFYQGQQCSICSINGRSAKRRLDYGGIKQEFQERGYKLITETYIGALEKLEYICEKHEEEGIQEIIYGNFQQGQGCKYCFIERNPGHYCTTLAERNKGKWLNVKAIVYFLKCYSDSEVFYKIGITSRTLKERFPSDYSLPYNYDILGKINTNLYQSIYIETLLHDAHKEYQYKPTKLFGGWTECFRELNIKEIKRLAS